VSCEAHASHRRAQRLADAAFTIAPVHSAADLDAVRGLFRDYVLTPDVAVCVEGFEAEIAGLPGIYAEPRGTLLLARVGTEAAGCIVLKPVGDDVAEMKRLFVRPQFRGRSIGAALTQAVIEAARRRGYARLRLDTLPHMKEARVIYSRLGFKDVTPWSSLPIAGASYMELPL
jgi:GNAT superfamily N-acetyltransferase